MDSLLLYKILKNRTGAEISASGNPATLPGTLKNNPMNEMKIFGRSKWETTTGAQLWEFGDIKSSVVAAKKFSTSLKKGKYTITADIESTDTDSETCLVTIGKKYINLPREKGVSATFELTEESAEIRVYASEDYNNSVGDTVSLKNVMLNVGDTALPYEPYTGGQPSPNPEYPQEIISAGMKWSTGAQLYDMDTRLNVGGIEYEKNGTAYTVNIVKTSGNLLCVVPFQFSKEDVDATLSVSQFSNLEQANVRIKLLDLEDNVVGTLWAKKTEKEVSAKCSKIRFDWSKGGKFIVSDLMLNYGGVALPYEPYTDGVPKLYGDKINLEVHGKNLFNLEYAINQKNWSGPSGYWYIPYYVGKGNTVSVTYGAEIPVGLRAYIYIHDYPGKTDNAKMWMYHSVGGNLTNNKCTFIAETDYIYLNAAGDYLSVIKKYMADLQIEVSPSPTGYEPYHTPQSLSIQTPTGLQAIPVTSGGNYTDTNGQQWIADYIDLKRGKYVQRVWQKTFDGSESWEIYRTMGYCLVNILPEKMTNREVLCNQLRRIDGGIGSDVIIVGAFGTNSTIYIENCTLRDNTLVDKGLSNWKAHLAKHPLVVMTYLDEPIERDLTPSEIQAYQELTTYAGTTIVENDADCYMEVSAGGGDALRAKKLALLLGD